MPILNLFLKELGVLTEIKTFQALKNINHIFLAVLLTKLFVLMINLASPLFLTEEKKCKQ